MSSLFGTGRASQPSLSAADAQAKKQQIMQEVTQQLGESPLTLLDPEYY